MKRAPSVAATYAVKPPRETLARLIILRGQAGSAGTERALNEAHKWADFYLVAGPSAAVLIGLLFVTLSINRTAVEAHPPLGGQARQAVYALASILVVSLLVLIPNQSSAALGVELLIGALLNLLSPSEGRFGDCAPLPPQSAGLPRCSSPSSTARCC